MKLYSYFRSSAAYRVRIALHLKGLPFETVAVHLAKGEQKTKNYANTNPQQLIPSLQLDTGEVLTQSLAIMEYLDEVYPDVPLLPDNATDRAMVRAMCQLVACDTHPLNNLRVLQYLTGELGVSDVQKQAWYAHWIGTNFIALEKLLENHAGTYCFGDTPTLADCCLVPQVYNAMRFNVDIGHFSQIVRVAENCRELEAFILASPEKQVDFE